MKLVRYFGFLLALGTGGAVLAQTPPGEAQPQGVMGKRILTFMSVIRVHQIEPTREIRIGQEAHLHTVDSVSALRKNFEKAFPGGRMTWSFSWRALNDQRDNYRDIRKLVAGYHRQYGDEVTFIPGTYFAPMYNSREQINRDLHDGLKLVSEMVGNGYRPKSVIAGFLPAENQRYLAEVEGIHVCQGVIFSQFSVDYGDGEGSLCYPYYPSREHFCKPAQGPEDFIDCVCVDGWSVDFLCARFRGVTRGINSRLGLGPIETARFNKPEDYREDGGTRTLQQKLGIQEQLHTVAVHFDDGFKRNGFAHTTTIDEVSVGHLVKGVLPVLGAEMRRRWPDMQCWTLGEFGEAFRSQFKDNSKLDYRFVQRGTGLGEAGGDLNNLEIRWFMNRDFRLALVRDWTGKPNREFGEREKVIDFTRYDLKAQEPPDPTPGRPIRNWSLMNRLNQKQSRPQDKPVYLEELSAEDQAIIRKRLPELFAAMVVRAETNLAPLASPSTSFVSGHETLEAINDGFEPKASNDHSHGCYGNWPQTGKQWVEYEWSQPISTGKIDVYWWDDAHGVRLPKACRVLSWDGKAFVQLAEVGVAGGRYNTTTFNEVTTPKLRLEFDGNEKFSTGIIEWKVYGSGTPPKLPPRVSAGNDSVVVFGGEAHLKGTTAAGEVAWSGPAGVTFGNPHALATTARFAKAGTYELRLTATANGLSASATTRVTVEPPPPGKPLQFVEPRNFTLTSPFWRDRIKGQIVNWIPHCVNKLNDPKLTEGGIENFVQAGNKLAGKPCEKNLGHAFANAYVHNTLEAMCLALLVDAQGDPKILAAQAAMRKTIEDWIPKILAAQEPDGYLHTHHTIGGQKRWSNRGDHEGYCAGYFIEAALAHWLMTGGKDTRLYDAAKKLADCWDNNLGPSPKKAWYDGHEEMEQALIRLAWHVNQHEGAGKGDRYVKLAKFLCDSRRNGGEYDQSHLPVTEQAEAVGHAVRAVYLYSGMAGVAMETGDIGYQSAVKSLWNSVVNRKYYVTGSVGSVASSEGFGKDFALDHKAYSESCASCGLVMFQHKMQMIYHDARYADLMEETMYNALLGSVDLAGQNFTYTNPLDSSAARYKWHGCPCCVGNIPRVLLMLPTWTYTTDAGSIYVNLYVGSKVQLGDVELVQTTDYPWSGNVALTVNPAKAKRFTLHLRVPDYSVSELYTGTPASGGLASLKVNDKPVKPVIENGFAVVERTWKPGDKVELVIPLAAQRVKAVEQIMATRGRVALRYGPLVYNLESVDQNLDSVLSPSAPLTTEWRPDLLGGVLAIKGVFADGKPLLAIPNYARLNRGGRSIVWIKEQ